MGRMTKEEMKEKRKEKISEFRERIFYPLVCILTVIITLFFTITGAYAKKSYDISIGSVSPEKFVAPSQLENTYATEKLRDSAESEVQVIYMYDEEVNRRISEKVRVFFEDASKARAADKPSSLTAYISLKQAEYLCDMSRDDYTEFADSLNDTINSVLDEGIKEINDKTLSLIKQEIKDYDEVRANLKYRITASFIEPNMFPDEELTQKAREEKRAAVEPVIILKNQKIVDKGEIITEEIYSILDDCGYVKKDMLAENLVPIIGLSIFIVVFLAVIFMYIRIYYPVFASTKPEVVLLFSIYLLMLLAAGFLKGMPYMCRPILVFTFLISLLISRRLAIMLNFAATIICFFAAGENVSAIFYFSIAGTITSIISRQAYDRTRLVKSAMLSSVINAFIAASLSCFFDKEIPILKSGLYALAASGVSYIAALGSLTIWEILFGIVTDVKLLQLTNTDNILLRRLLMEAPGTYNHSLMVGNLAEAAAYSIGANPIIAKVGAYYHDIGKLKCPQYFTENIKSENPHDNFDPYKSKKIITDHVSYGMELAKKYKLPDIIRDIILEHHGTTMVKFFYFKAKQLYPDAKENDFRYKGRIPQTKESAVVMLADTAEAAVRSFEPEKKTRQEIEEFVSKLVKERMTDGQLSESRLLIGDTDTIIHSFMSIFDGMYHNRISYPEDEKQEKE